MGPFITEARGGASARFPLKTNYIIHVSRLSRHYGDNHWKIFFENVGHKIFHFDQL